MNEASGEWDRCVLYLRYKEEGRAVRKRKSGKGQREMIIMFSGFFLE